MMAKALGMYDVKSKLNVTAGGGNTVVCTDAGELFTFGYGEDGMMGHGGTGDELVPRLVEALAGKAVVGVSAGDEHAAVWTDEGELFTFGFGSDGRLGHGGGQDELVPRLVESDPFTHDDSFIICVGFVCNMCVNCE